jgi:hypothetical protein
VKLDEEEWKRAWDTEIDEPLSKEEKEQLFSEDNDMSLWRS